MRKEIQFSFSVFQDQNQPLSANRVSMVVARPVSAEQNRVIEYSEDRSVPQLNEFACDWISRSIFGVKATWMSSGGLFLKMAKFPF